MLNKYNIQARIIPTIISSIPILFCQYYFLDTKILWFISYLWKFNFIPNLGLSLIILFFISQLNRFISKTFFEKKEMFMPSTDFLLYNDWEYSLNYKKSIYNKLELDFNIKLPSKKEQEENVIDARKRISEVMSLARKRIWNWKLLLQYNIEYWFLRNLIWWSIFAIIFSLIWIILSLCKNDLTLIIISWVLFLFFLIIFLMRNIFLEKTWKLYARTLIQEYMAN